MGVDSPGDFAEGGLVLLSLSFLAGKLNLEVLLLLKCSGAGRGVVVVGGIQET